MKLIYANETLDDNGIFAAGPTPRSKEVESWRPEAINLFREHGYQGSLFIPETRGDEPFDWERQVQWEESGLNKAKCIMFWVPRDLQILPGFTTNIEFGMHCKSGKVVFGAPTEAVKVGYMRYYANKLLIPNADTLDNTVKLAIQMWQARGGK